MLIISELNYLLSQKVPEDIFNKDEKAIIFYMENDTVPAKALKWLNKVNDKLNLLSYDEIGDKGNISFAAGAYAIQSVSHAVAIVGDFDKGKRELIIGEENITIYTLNNFSEVAEISASLPPVRSAKNKEEDTIAQVASLIPPRAVPNSMDVNTYAAVLDNCIAKVHGDDSKIFKALSERIGEEDAKNSLDVLKTTGILGKIIETVID